MMTKVEKDKTGNERWVQNIVFSCFNYGCGSGGNLLKIEDFPLAKEVRIPFVGPISKFGVAVVEDKSRK